MKSHVRILVRRLFLLVLMFTFLTRRQIISALFIHDSQQLPEIHRSYIKENNAIFNVKESNKPSPTPTPTTKVIRAPLSNESTVKESDIKVKVENYQLEPCSNDQEEGCYMIRDAPSETMATVEELNQATNTYRVAHSLTELYIDAKICEIADARAHEIDAHFSHDGFSSHIENGDYDFIGFSMIAENLWQGSFSGVHIVEFGWDKSDGHRANLQGNWSRGCAGIYEDNAVFVFVN